MSYAGSAPASMCLSPTKILLYMASYILSNAAETGAWAQLYCCSNPFLNKRYNGQS